jgi:2-methylcitrate dehydratase PrpD
MSGYLKQTADFICRCQFNDLPAEVVQRARQVVADSVAVIASGVREKEVSNLIHRTVAAGGPRVSTIIGTGHRTEPSKAALINGTAGTFLELDEGNQFSRGHPAIHVVPAALAVAEEANFSGRELLTAVVLGYEICARIGIACKIRMSMHPHGTWGTTGAAVAVGKLMGYDADGMKELINVSSSLGLATSRRTMLEGGLVRNVYAGVSGHMGILAHQLVQSGFTGEADGLQTVYGSVVSDTFLPEVMTEALGERFEIARNYFKQHACCRYNHGALDALGEIMASRPGGRLTPEEVAGVEVTTYSLAAQLCEPHPQNTLAGKFSIPFAVATYIVKGHTGLESFSQEAVRDPAARDLAERVTVCEDPALTAMMPDRRPSKVAVTLKNGIVLEAQTFTNKGDTEDPYSPEELRAKYDGLAGLVWEEETAAAIYSDISKLEQIDDVNSMTERMRKIGTSR